MRCWPDKCVRKTHRINKEVGIAIVVIPSANSSIDLYNILSSRHEEFGEFV